MARPRNPTENDAYQLWARLPDKNDPHAMRQISQQIGVPIKTLYDWKDRYQWKGRWLADVHAIGPEILEEGMATLVQGWPIVTGRLMKVIVNGSDKDAINAARVYTQIVGADKQQPMAPGKKAAPRAISPETIDRVKELDRGELWKRAIDAGADNMDRALRQRSARRNGGEPDL